MGGGGYTSEGGNGANGMEGGYGSGSEGGVGGRRGGYGSEFGTGAQVSLNARSDVPGFHYLLRNSPDMMEYIFDNQLWRGSAMSNGVFHTYQHPGAKVERGFEEVLQEAVKQYDSWTFPQDVNAYWSFQIRLARRN